MVRTLDDRKKFRLFRSFPGSISLRKWNLWYEFRARSRYCVVKFESCLHSDTYIFSSSNGGVEIVCSAERSLQGLHDGVLRFNVESSIEILHMVEVGQFRD